MEHIDGLTANARILAGFGWIKAPLLDKYMDAVATLDSVDKDTAAAIRDGAQYRALQPILVGMRAVIDAA